MFLRFGTLALSISGSYLQKKNMFEISHSYTLCVTLIIHLKASTGVFRNQHCVLRQHVSTVFHHHSK